VYATVKDALVVIIVLVVLCSYINCGINYVTMCKTSVKL
jgi:hypothetical protein